MPPRIADTSVLTTFNLAIIAVLAVLTILAILWGMRLKRERREAERIEAERVAAEGETASTLPTLIPASPAPAGEAPLAPSPSPVPPQGRGDARGEAPAMEPSIADEPVAAAAPLEASPASEAGDTPARDEAGGRPVTDIKGLGPKVAARLAELGVTTVTQIAALDANAAERLDAQLGPFSGRMARDRWIEQARFLATGDVKGFEAVFGRL